jgi:hypothetical protein
MSHAVVRLRLAVGWIWVDPQLQPMRIMSSSIRYSTHTHIHAGWTADMDISITDFHGV